MGRYQDFHRQKHSCWLVNVRLAFSCADILSLAPVLDGEKLIGFVSVRDAVAHLVDDHSSEMMSMSAYVNGSY